MIAFKNGTVILIDDETDEDPIVIKTELKKITKTQWEVDGLCIAILGELVDDEIIKEEEEDEKEMSKNNEVRNLCYQRLVSTLKFHCESIYEKIKNSNSVLIFIDYWISYENIVLNWVIRVFSYLARIKSLKEAAAEYFIVKS